MHSSSSGSPVVSMACCVLPMACQIVAPRIAFAQDLSIRPNRIVTQGQATLIVDNLYRCPVTVDNYRPTAVGRITANDGTVITVPAVTVFEKASARKAFDAETSTARMRSGPSTRAVPTGRLSTVAPST